MLPKSNLSDRRYRPNRSVSSGRDYSLCIRYVVLTTVLVDAIDLTGAVELLANLAFSVHRNGIITDVAAYFSVVPGLTLAEADITIQAQRYSWIIILVLMLDKIFKFDCCK